MPYEEALEYAKSYITLCGVPIDTKETTKCIVEALEKQIPHKVDMTKFYGGALCPSCGELFEKYMDNWKSPYCQYCGVKLDWNEEEE